MDLWDAVQFMIYGLAVLMMIPPVAVAIVALGSFLPRRFWDWLGIHPYL